MADGEVAVGESPRPSAIGNASISQATFILGNGPLLPVEALPLLAGQFTIGVNRILRSGFTPTVLLWVDATVYRDCGEEMDACGAILVCDRSVACRSNHHGLPTHVGDAALWPCTPTTLCCDGNTGCCAARWALALGCRPVYLVGMEATYAAGRTDFYGRNCRHGPGTLKAMRRELDRLAGGSPEAIRIVHNAEALATAIAALPPVDTGETRRRLVALLQEVNHGA